VVRIQRDRQTLVLLLLRFVRSAPPTPGRPTPVFLPHVSKLSSSPEPQCVSLKCGWTSSRLLLWSQKTVIFTVLCHIYVTYLWKVNVNLCTWTPRHEDMWLKPTAFVTTAADGDDCSASPVRYTHRCPLIRSSERVAKEKVCLSLESNPDLSVHNHSFY
jgi:hypothetical protein